MNEAERTWQHMNNIIGLKPSQPFTLCEPITVDLRIAATGVSLSLAQRWTITDTNTNKFRLWNLAIQRKTLVCGCQAILPRTNKWPNSVRKPTNSSALCAEPSWYIQSIQTCRTLYLSIVRCHLGYATQVWSPQSIGLLKRVENVQRRATKLILKLPFHCDVTYKTRLQLTNLLPISYWHEFSIKLLIT